jgi:hypothetical protein
MLTTDGRGSPEYAQALHFNPMLAGVDDSTNLIICTDAANLPILGAEGTKFFSGEQSQTRILEDNVLDAAGSKMASLYMLDTPGGVW